MSHIQLRQGLTHGQIRAENNFSWFRVRRKFTLLLNFIYAALEYIVLCLPTTGYYRILFIKTIGGFNIISYWYGSGISTIGTIYCVGHRPIYGSRAVTSLWYITPQTPHAQNYINLFYYSPVDEKIF